MPYHNENIEQADLCWKARNGLPVMVYAYSVFGVVPI